VVYVVKGIVSRINIVVVVVLLLLDSSSGSFDAMISGSMRGSKAVYQRDNLLDPTP
jgi:hypothetical protein